MRIVIDRGIRGDHPELRRLVAAGFDGVEGSDVEVRVRPAGRPSRSYTGRAYPTPPRSARLSPGVRYLVVLFVPTVRRNRGYPKTHRYPRLRTAPWITTRDWRERLLALSAHEACHVRQFRLGLRRSEVEAERWAKRAIEGGAETGDRDAAAPIEEAPATNRRPEQLTFALWPASLQNFT